MPGLRLPFALGLGGGLVTLTVEPERSILSNLIWGNLPSTVTAFTFFNVRTSESASRMASASPSAVVGKSFPDSGNMKSPDGADPGQARGYMGQLSEKMITILR